MKKKIYIKTIKDTDIEMFLAFRKLGHLTPEMLTEDLGMSPGRIANFRKDGYIGQVGYITKKEHKHCYRLIKKGSLFAKEFLGIDSIYKHKSPRLDLPRAEEYFSEIRNKNYKNINKK